MVVAEGHFHDPLGPCPQELAPGKFSFGQFKDGDFIRYRTILDHCPLHRMDNDMTDVLFTGKQHATDSRMLNMDLSSADKVDQVLLVSEKEQQRRLSMAIGDVVNKALGG